MNTGFFNLISALAFAMLVGAVYSAHAQVTISVTPQVLDFGDVDVGFVRERTIEITNTGDETAELLVTAFAPFGVGDLVGEEVTEMFSAAPGETISVGLTFAPDPADFDTDVILVEYTDVVVLEFGSSGEFEVVDVSGTGIGREVVETPEPDELCRDLAALLDPSGGLAQYIPSEGIDVDGISAEFALALMEYGACNEAVDPSRRAVALDAYAKNLEAVREFRRTVRAVLRGLISEKGASFEEQEMRLDDILQDVATPPETVAALVTSGKVGADSPWPSSDWQDRPAVPTLQNEIEKAASGLAEALQQLYETSQSANFTKLVHFAKQGSPADDEGLALYVVIDDLARPRPVFSGFGDFDGDGVTNAEAAADAIDVEDFIFAAAGEPGGEPVGCASGGSTSRGSWADWGAVVVMMMLMVGMKSSRAAG